MEGLGALGFWLGLGIFLAGGAIAGALKELGKEREKQETVRALLTGKAGPEVLEYLREKDAAEAAHARAQWTAMGGDLGGRSTGAVLMAAAVAMFSFMAGMFSLAHLSRPVPQPGGGFGPPAGQSEFLPIGVMIGFWVAGLIVAWLIWHFGRDRKNDDQRDA